MGVVAPDQDHHKERPRVPGADVPSTPPALVASLYARWGEGVSAGRERLGRPLTFTEKVLVNHQRHPEGQVPTRVGATPTSIPTASPFRTPWPRSWLCSWWWPDWTRSRSRPPSTVITSSRPRSGRRPTSAPRWT